MASSRVEPRVLVPLLLGLHLLLGVTSAERSSLTIDEHAHLAAGVTYLTQRDARLNPEHPVLAKVWCALPILAGEVRFDPRDPAWEDAAAWIPIARAGRLAAERERARRSVTAEWRFAQRFLYVQNRDALSDWVRRARFMTLLLSLALGLLIYRFTARTWGVRAGLVALTVWTFSPTALAHARLITTDVCNALFATATLLAAIRWLEAEPDAPAPREAALVAAALAGALASKHSSLYLVGVLGLLLPIWAARRTGPARAAWLRRRALEGVGVVVVAAASTLALEWALFGRPVWWLGLSVLLERIPQSETVRSFLLGAVHDHRQPHYFVVAFLLKASLPLVALTVWGLTAAVLAGAWRSPVPAALLLYGVVTFGLVSARFPNVGVRYLLPLFPLLAIGAGALFASTPAQPDRRTGARRAVVALVLLHALAGAVAWPRYLSSMNAISLTRGKAYFLDDSNLDWGQGLRDLSAWCAERDVERIALLPATPIGDPSFYGVPAAVIRPADAAGLPGDSLLAVSVLHLQRNPGLRALLADWPLVDVVGDTYYIVRRATP